MNRRSFLEATSGFLGGVVAAEAIERATPFGLQRLVNEGRDLLSKQRSRLSELTGLIERARPYLAEAQPPSEARRVEDRTFDIDVSFEAADPISGIAEANLSLEGIYPPHIPSEAIPQEPELKVALSPAETHDGWQRYSHWFSELKGGKEYRLTLTVKNSEEKVNTAQMKVPYVREFTNLARKASIILNAHYMPFFEPGTWNAHWDRENGTPILGQYESGDEFVTARHIDWASGFGIKSFSLNSAGPLDHSDARIRRIISHPLIGDMNFFLIVDTFSLLGTEGPWNIDDPAIRERLLEVTRYVVENFVSHPNYLRLQGRCPIYYWSSISWIGDVASLTKEFREIANESGIELLIIGDPVHFYEPKSERIKPFDAITQWANYHADPKQLKNLDKKIDTYYDKWSKMAKNANVAFIPSALPGFRKPSQLDKFAVLPRSIESFTSQLEIAARYMDPDLELLFLTSFNDWTEDTQLEPSGEDGFAYLDLVKQLVESS